MKVSFDYAIDTFDFMLDVFTYYFDREKEEFLMIDEWSEEGKKLLEAIEYQYRYIYIDSREDNINEYRLMHSFLEEVSNKEYIEIKYLLQESGAFRRFKHYIDRKNLSRSWFKYREDALKEHVLEWCESNGIEVENIEEDKVV